MKSAKRNYKDSLFVHMFGRNVNAKEYFLSLYNALHDTNLKIGEVTIKPVTLSNTVYTGLENDVAMQIDDPLPHGCGKKAKREFFYFASLFCLKNSR